MTEYYLYQCAECGSTLYSDYLPDHERYTSIINGELCSECEQKSYEDDDDDWD